jgi:hypothetical protein
MKKRIFEGTHQMCQVFDRVDQTRIEEVGFLNKCLKPDIQNSNSCYEQSQ